MISRFFIFKDKFVRAVVWLVVFCLIGASFLVVMTPRSWAALEIGFTSADLKFVPEVSLVNQKSRIIVTAHNYSNQMFKGEFAFYVDSKLIAPPQLIEVAAGKQVDVWEVWRPEELGSFHVQVELLSSEVSLIAYRGVVAVDQLVDQDFDQDGLADSIDLDDDNDGLPDKFEFKVGLNSLLKSDAKLDLDKDGLSNYQEYQLKTDLKLVDTDRDGVIDSQDKFPLNSLEQVDTDGDGLGDNQDSDDDNDGLYDLEEEKVGLNSKLVDTDGDGLRDKVDPFPFDKDNQPPVSLKKEVEVVEVAQAKTIIKEIPVEVSKPVVVKPAVVEIAEAASFKNAADGFVQGANVNYADKQTELTLENLKELLSYAILFAVLVLIILLLISRIFSRNFVIYRREHQAYPRSRRETGY